jgi:hypothetical protein
MRVIVCGSRDHSNVAFIWSKLDTLHAARPFTAFMQGGQRGADRMARDWARTKPELNGLRFQSDADWTRYGHAAGPIRNWHMLEWKPDLVIGFPLPGSVGTWDMLCKAERAGIERIIGA